MRAQLKSGDTALQVLSLALYTELVRFPRLFVVVESDVDVGPGPFTLSILRIEQSVQARSGLSSLWYVNEIQRAGKSRYLLSLISDPGSDLQVQPFAENNKSAEELLKPRLGELTDWQAPHLRRTKIEALLSRQETFEQLARRIAGYTNDVFAVTSKSKDQWTMTWAPTLEVLSAAAQGSISNEEVMLLAQTERVTEGELQRITVPVNFDSTLLEPGKASRVRHISRPVQWGEPATTAVSYEAPCSETGEPLTRLESRWYAVTQSEALEALWQGGSLDAEDGREVVLGSLFLYESDAAYARTSQALTLLVRWLGCGRLSVPSVAEGWAAFALAIPLEAVPKDKALLHYLIEKSQFSEICAHLVESMDCGRRALACHPSPLWGPTLAIVVDSPHGKDPIGRSDNHQAYRTKIWVRLPGVAGAVEVDWAVPFACHGGNGDLILVPMANTLGYLLLQEGHGAPLFFAMTHYRDAFVSSKINPASHKHGLTVQGGLIVDEVLTVIDVKSGKSLLFKSPSIRNLISSPAG